MRKSYGQGSEAIANYVHDLFQPEDEVLAWVRQRAAEAKLPDIHVPALDGLCLEIIARASGAKRAVEIGVLAGYSGICLMRGMGSGAKLWALEKSESHAKVARESFSRAGIHNAVELLVGNALTLLPTLEASGPFDLVFIDADKENYLNYFRWASRNLRQGGVLLADNCFAFGEITEAESDRPVVQSLRRFNAAVAEDSSLRATILPSGEGLLFAVKL